MSTLHISDYQHRTNLVAKEHDVLDYWDKTDTFKKSITQRPETKPYIFYDGPPFATGLPHYGHILASTAKDVIPRYWTMKGYRVERVWGWDCHGLPIENIVEKQLELKGGKKGIEEFGIAEFNEACRSAIWKFDKEWERIIRRIGRWVDFKNSYKTMDTTFMESVWWAFKELYQKGLIYQGRKVILYCPRCSTPLSNFEIAMDNSYKDLESPSTTYKYKLKNHKDTYLLAWSTTPWNKLATPALAVNPDMIYVKVKQGKEFYILAKNRIEILHSNPKYKVVETYQGKDLEQFEFELHYDFYPDRQGAKAGIVIADAFVTAEEGTGVVTLAVYGEDDYRIMTQHRIQLVEHVDDRGILKPEVTPWAGQFMLKVNPQVNADLNQRGLIYHDQPRVHSVPVCYRCETRLYHNPVPAWFIDIQKIKADLIKQNQKINWYPDHLKYGRFGKGLETAPDWNISRSRYWGNPLPIWIGEKTGRIRVIGSIAELKQWAVYPKQVNNLTDIHREFLDPIEVWVDDAKTEIGKRTPEIFDCWVESGSMPFASIHYPFENKQRFEASYPAQYIVEYIAQTRAWFYTVHVMSVGLFNQPAFENALTTGNVLAEDGNKMSKSKKNYPDPEPFFEKYGVDALRFYLMSSVVMKADNLNFSETEVKEIHNKLINILWNVFSFYKLYAGKTRPPHKLPHLNHVLDQWIVSRTTSLIQTVTKALDQYNTPSACRIIQEFVTDLSTWYLRRSRDRLRDSTDAVQVTGWVLDRLIHTMAPLTPFITELIYQNLHQTNNSLHLNDWPEVDYSLIDQNLELNMDLARKIVEQLHALRQQSGIKVRQPLSLWSLDDQSAKMLQNQLPLLQVIAEETNIKSYTPLNLDIKNNRNKHTITSPVRLGNHLATVYLDTEITPELQAEGKARELVRQIQDLRKKHRIKLNQHIEVTLPAWPVEFEQYIKNKTLADKLVARDQISIKSI